MEKFHIQRAVVWRQHFDDGCEGLSLSSENLWKSCRNCEKQMPVKANSCPHCGKNQYRFRKLKWLGGGFIALIVVSAVLAPNKAKEQTSDAGRTAAATRPAVTMPEQQAKFLAVIADYSKRFEAASNELQQSALRDERRASMRTVLGAKLGIDGWNGTLWKLETNSEGKAVITVRLGTGLDILTWNNALSDTYHSTMIEKGTPLYAALMNMKTRDKVKVSGSFVPAELDGIQENSITIRGAMTAPEFLFKFTSISKQD